MISGSKKKEKEIKELSWKKIKAQHRYRHNKKENNRPISLMDIGSKFSNKIVVR